MQKSIINLLIKLCSIMTKHDYYQKKTSIFADISIVNQMKKSSAATNFDKDKIYKTLFDSATEGLVLVNESGEIIFTNNSLSEMFEYEYEELVGEKIEILIPSAYRKNHVKKRDGYNKAPEKRQMGAGIDLMGVKKSGLEFPVEISLNSIPFGSQKAVMGLVTDISKRRFIENENEQIREALRALHEITSNQSISLTSKIKTLLQFGSDEFNLSNGSLHKYESGGFTTIESNKTEKNHSRQHDLNEKMHNVIKSKQVDYSDSEVSLSFKGIKIFLENNLYGIICFYGEPNKKNDHHKLAKELLKLISEAISGELYRSQVQISLENLNKELDARIKSRTAELEKSEKLYMAISRNFPDGSINVLDKELNYIFVEGKELINDDITSESLIGSSYMNKIPKDSSEGVRDLFKEIFLGETQSFEIELNNKYYQIDAVPLHEVDNSIERILVVERNITIRKETEQEIVKTLEKERELNELKTRFVSMASHEFRTPLGTILSSATLIGKYVETNQQNKREKHINRIKTSVSNLTSILNDFLSLEKVEAGKIDINRNWFDIKSLFSNTVDEMQTVCKQNQIIRYEHFGELHSFTDELLMKNILFNLTSNAIKYSGENSIISITSQNSEDELLLTIEDQGIGIPEKDQGHLFERFFRAKNATNIQGTGLGLNIVKKYVNSMHGTIEYESKEGIGTKFIIRLPQTEKYGH